MPVVDGDHNRVEVGDHCGGGGCLALRGEGNRLLIGDRTYFIGVHLLLVSGGCRLVIGNGCVFSESEPRTPLSADVVSFVTPIDLGPMKSALSRRVCAHVDGGVFSPQ